MESGSAASSRIWASGLGAHGHWEPFARAPGVALWAVVPGSAASPRIWASRLGAPGHWEPFSRGLREALRATVSGSAASSRVWASRLSALGHWQAFSQGHLGRQARRPRPLGTLLVGAGSPSRRR